MKTRIAVALAAMLWLVTSSIGFSQSQLSYEVRQLTSGPSHHFYGYIGHVGNSPYSADGKHLVALRTTFQDRMPGPQDAADIVLLDAEKNYAETKVEETRGWNPQQGAMIYWNPEQPSRQFFFNDRDPKTGKVFTALYDIVDKKRVKEFRFDATPAANGGVKQDGGSFSAINYARMARLRPVTGYPGTWDWTEGVNHPHDDGLFVVDVKSGGAEADCLVPADARCAHRQVSAH